MIRVLGDRVLVLLPPHEEKVSPSGIVLVTDPDRMYTPTRGIVVQLGEKSNTCDLDDVRADVHTWFLNVGETPIEEWGGGMALIRDSVDRVLMQLLPAAFDVQVGDCVLFGSGDGEQFHDDGRDYVVIRESEIIGIVEPKSEAA